MIKFLKKLFMKEEIKIERRIHQGWVEWDQMPLAIKAKMSWGIKGWVGKYQYIYSTSRGKISLVYIRNFRNIWSWEICQLDDSNLFNGIERFNFKEEAENRIRSLL